VSIPAAAFCLSSLPFLIDAKPDNSGSNLSQKASKDHSGFISNPLKNNGLIKEPCEREEDRAGFQALERPLVPVLGVLKSGPSGSFPLCLFPAWIKYTFLS
jgi:hypothetical protein